MNLLIIAVITSLFSASYSFACGTKNMTLVNECSLDDQFATIMLRLFPTLTYVDKSEYDVDPVGHYTFDPAISGTYYERLLMDIKPAQTVLDAELIAWKSEHQTDFAFKDRIYNLNRFRRRMKACNISKKNAAKEKKRIYEEKDETTLLCLEGKDSPLDSEDAAQLQFDTSRANAKDYFNNFDCSTISDQFKRNTCWMFK